MCEKHISCNKSLPFAIIFTGPLPIAEGNFNKSVTPAVV